MKTRLDTVAHEFRDTDPYGWLSGDDDYEFPPDLLAMLADSPEKHSAQILASIDEQSVVSEAMFVNPVFFDPQHGHGLLSLAERELIGVVVSAINACVTCLIVHTHNLGKQIGDHSRARRIAINYRAARLSEQQHAIADFA